MYYVKVLITAICAGLFAAQSWLGLYWLGFDNPEHGIVVACLVAMGGIVARTHLEGE
jgi:hypothetical protein